jgi:hypothetical protein
MSYVFILYVHLSLCSKLPLFTTFDEGYLMNFRNKLLIPEIMQKTEYLIFAKARQPKIGKPSKRIKISLVNASSRRQFVRLSLIYIHKNVIESPSQLIFCGPFINVAPKQRLDTQEKYQHLQAILH